MNMNKRNIETDSIKSLEGIAWAGLGSGMVRIRFTDDTQVFLEPCGGFSEDGLWFRQSNETSYNNLKEKSWVKAMSEKWMLQIVDMVIEDCNSGRLVLHFEE